MSKDIHIDVSIGKRCKQGLVPEGGETGQVLTKTERGYRWENNPVTVATTDYLPQIPSSTCFYLIQDIMKLVYWDGSSWMVINQNSDLMYDEDEEMMYIQKELD